jgi:hypothetical protein
MTEVSRRTVISVGGASLVLAGCKFGSDEPNNANDKGYAKTGPEEAGPCVLHGEPVYVYPPFPTDNFAPSWLCLAYIKFEQGKLSVRHGYIEIDKTKFANNTYIRTQAEYVIAELRSNTTYTKTKYVRHNFDDFSMNSQQVVIIFLDNDEKVVRFNPELDRVHVIRFGALLGSPTTKKPRDKRAKKNNAFHNLEAFSAGGRICYKMFFHNLDDTHGPIEKVKNENVKKDDETTWWVYSMNIHLEYAIAGNDGNVVAYIPMVIDPDTGNMGSIP